MPGLRANEYTANTKAEHCAVDERLDQPLQPYERCRHKPRIAIVRNVFVSVGMSVRNSVISFLRYSCPMREEEHRNCEHVPRRQRCALRVNEDTA
jgi:hypothetical protein